MSALNDPIRVLHRLKNKLDRDIPQLDKLTQYAKGETPPPWTPDPDVDAEFRALLNRSKLNYMRPVIDSRVERLKVKGFRLSASENTEADNEVWQIWQANRLDREMKKAFREALTKGRVYVSVFYPNPSLTGHDKPVIMIEDPCQVYVEYEPGTHRRSAAIKVWHDDRSGARVEYANVYLNNVIYKYSWNEAADIGSDARGEWVEREETVYHDLGIPIVPLLNSADLAHNGQSEIADVLASQDRINEMVFNRSLAGWFAAHQQKWMAGIDIPKDPETGEPMMEYLQEMSKRMVAGRPVVTEDSDANFGTFAATNPNSYTEIIEAEKQSIGEQKKLPRHYFLKEGSSVNGQSIKAAEAGLVATVKDKQEDYGETIEEVLMLARQAAGHADTPIDAEIIWADPEHRTEGERTDSIVKQVQQGILSTETALEDLGKSPQQVARELERLRQQVLDDPLNALSDHLRGQGDFDEEDYS